MEMMYQFNFKPLLLMYIMASVLSCILNFSKSELYFIRPTYPKDVICPRNPCQQLNYFDRELGVPKPPVSYEFDTVTMILIEGYHTIRASTYNFGSPGNSRIMHIIYWPCTRKQQCCNRRIRNCHNSDGHDLRKIYSLESLFIH